MTTKEYNQYIKNYLEHDITRSAIMLTAPWGTGKSYYIQNELIPFLNHDGENRCIVVSLYGLKDLQEISKALYLEVRAKPLTAKNEKLSAGKIIGKTIIKGVASFFGVDLDVSQKDLNKLYNSIDLSGKLIVFEDLERSCIEIKEILGYVNNLCEQDGVKVLLVTNEQEFIKYQENEQYNSVEEKNFANSIEKSTVSKTKLFTKETEEYLKIKEKTISDTIHFISDFEKSIIGIVQLFDENKYIKQLLLQKNNLGYRIYFEIIDVMNTVESYNLRALVFACQKTVDIFKNIDKTIALDFFESTLLSIVAFSLKFKKSGILKWKDEKQSPSELGCYKYPLLKTCFNYIQNQILDVKELESAEEEYLRQKDYKNANDDLQILYSFYIRKQEELESALLKIKENLIQNNFNYDEYGTLANYLIAVIDLTSDETIVPSCLSLIKDNLSKCNGDLDALYHRIEWHSGYQLEGEQDKEYKKITAEMLAIVDKRKKELLTFNCSVSNIDEFTKMISQNNSHFINKQAFASQINMEQLVGVLAKCTAAQIYEFRGSFTYIYSSGNIGEFLSGDKPALIELKDRLHTLVESGTIQDSIIKLQLTWFAINIERIILKLQN